MSVRPLEGRENPGRGGDGPRSRWSESPIPRIGRRRVRTVGVPPGLPVPTCSNTAYALTSATASSATFVVDPVEAGEDPFVKRDFGVYVNATLIEGGSVEVWATAIDADYPLTVPTASVTLSRVDPGYDGANDYIYITEQFGAGEVRGWTLAWDTPGAFSTLCCDAIYSE